MFETIRDSTNKSLPNIRPMCLTRWTVRSRALDSLIQNYLTLYETFEEVSKGSDEYARRAAGLLALMPKFSTFFGVCLSHMIFSATEILSTALQRKSTTCEDAAKAVKVCLHFLAEKRQEAAFTAFYQKTQELAKDLCDAPCLPRHRRVPRRLDEGGPAHVHPDPESYFRKMYLESLDRVSQEIERRVDQRNFSLVRNLEQLITGSASGQTVSIPDSIKQLYGKDLDFRQLSLELQLLPSVVSTDKGNASSVQAVIQAVRKNPILKEVEKMIRLYLTVPVTTSTAERTFSALKRIKTYLRASMSQERLNACMVMHVFQSRVAALDLNKVAREFVSHNERRSNFFGAF